MKIAGIDYSINSPGITKIELDLRFNIINLQYLGFSQNKKDQSDQIFWYSPEKFSNEFEKIIWIQDYIFNFIQDCSHIAIENYSFGSKGRVFNIAEATGRLKYYLYERGYSIRLYEPTSIKKFATGNGTADKFKMKEFYDKLESKPNLSYLIDGKKDLNKTKTDIIDSFFIANFLMLEMKLRAGIVKIEDLSKEHQSLIIHKKVKKIKKKNAIEKIKIVQNLIEIPFFVRGSI